MLRELANIQQKDRTRFRRWFEDDFFDLIVWYDQKKKIVGFQLCYDRFGKEHALTWHINRGFSHDRISTGFDEYHTLGAPVLQPDRAFPLSDVMERFRLSSADLDGEIVELVSGKLDEYGRTGGE